ncbi:5'-methylthioadenosine/S-adenosylhomocysteine nucleosidase [Paracoccus jiaweipingae]|uniref:5'-methylthioadenosine/S-adenosylhomocysteine nucleosidase n=1 Tax=unclassified Paracoccus (in: a-proteobacteria) TaxID=2688777 RepID=UPI0037A5D3C6
MSQTILPPLTPVAGLPVLFVMALDHEYGPALRSRITPLMTGVGPVEAAVVLSDALARLALAGQRPALVVSLGSAGSRALEQGAVFQAVSVSYRDMDATALGFGAGLTPFLDQPAQIALPVQVPGLPGARLSTGANIVSGDAYDGIDAEMVDMESYALCRACQRAGLPMMGLRGISDGAAPLDGLMDWTRYLDVIDHRLAAALDLLEAGLADGRVMLPAPDEAPG